MFKKIIMLFLFAQTVGVSFSQKTETDSLQTIKLQEVLVQYRQAIFGSKQKQVNTGASGYYLSSKELQLFDYFDVSQQLQQIPGVNIQQEDGFGLRPRISFRGISPGRSDKITLMEDGILIAPAPYTSPAAYYFPTAGRMHAFEILKGSSQIKYGPQTTAGVINMISTPIPKKQSAKVDAAWGSYNTKTIHAFAGNTYKNFGYLVETYHYGSDGFKELDFGEGKDTGFEKSDYTAKFMWKTAEGNSTPQSLLLKLQYSKEESDETYLGLSDADFKANPFRRYASSKKDEMKTNHQVYSLTHNIKPTSNFDITTTAYKTKFHRNWYKLGGFQNADGSKGKSISSILADPAKNKAAFDVLRGADTKEDEALKVKANNRNYEVKGIQTELNWAINDYHHITFGARYHYDNIDRFQWEDNYGMKDGSMLLLSVGKKGNAGNRKQESKAFASYIQYELKVDNLTIIPGLRYEHITQSRNEYGKNNTDRKKAAKYRENKTKVFLPGISFQYRFNDEVQLFAGAHKGFAPAGNTPNTKDENSYNYELGSRYSNNRLKSELVVFYSDYKNLLGADLVGTGGTGTGDAFNAGEAKAQGIEFLASYELIKKKNLSFPVMLTYTYTDTELKTDFKSKVRTWGVVKSGDEIPYIAKHQLGFIASLQHNRYALSLNAKYQSDMRTKAGQGTIAEKEKVGSYFTLDLSAKYHFNRHLTFKTAVTNLFNNEYEVGRSPYGLRPGRPIMFNLGLSFNI